MMLRRLRSREEIASFFDGLDIVGPGVVYLPRWHPGGGAPPQGPNPYPS
jgi:hypothetical protein